MVSLKNIFGCLKVLSLFMLFLSAGMFSFALEPINTLEPSDTSVAISCPDGYKRCCVNNMMTCVEDTGQICLVSCGTSSVEPITCTSGTVQYKPSGDCGTTSRTCCSDATWSNWGGVCSTTPSVINCSSSTKPDSTQTCINGTQTRTVECDTSTGTWTTGPWSECICDKTCSAGQVRDVNCACCDVSCYRVATGGQISFWCDCFSSDYVINMTCCTMADGTEYRLPTYYSSCSSFASAAGLSLNTMVAAHACNGSL